MNIFTKSPHYCTAWEEASAAAISNNHKEYYSQCVPLSTPVPKLFVKRLVAILQKYVSFSLEEDLVNVVSLLEVLGVAYLFVS